LIAFGQVWVLFEGNDGNEEGDDDGGGGGSSSSTTTTIWRWFKGDKAAEDYCSSNGLPLPPACLPPHASEQIVSGGSGGGGSGGGSGGG